MTKIPNQVETQMTIISEIKQLRYAKHNVYIPITENKLMNKYTQYLEY